MGRIWLVVLISLLAMPALAQVDPWNAGFDANPTDTDLVSEGDNEIRILKGAISERMLIQHQWRPGAGETNMGFHAEGSAWVEDRADCSTLAIDALQDIGRLCRDSDDDSLWVADDGGGAWHQIGPAMDSDGTAGIAAVVPQHGIILWDQGALSGDEDCNAVADDGCPCGWTEATEFQGLTVRGADSAAADPDIPDDDGDSCTGGGAPPCSVVANMYDDTLSILQMPAHTHDIEPDSTAGTNTMLVGGLSAPGWPQVTGSTGGGDDHYHPFRTVLFCRKN